MNKADLVKEVSKVVSTKKEAQASVECVLDTITKALKIKDELTVAGFGTFKVSNRKARTGRNPKTGEKILIQSRNGVKFTPVKQLRDAVQDCSEEYDLT